MTEVDIAEGTVIRMPPSHRMAALRFIRAVVAREGAGAFGPPEWRMRSLWDVFVSEYASLVADPAADQERVLQLALARL